MLVNQVMNIILCFVCTCSVKIILFCLYLLCKYYFISLVLVLYCCCFAFMLFQGKDEQPPPSTQQWQYYLEANIQMIV